MKKTYIIHEGKEPSIECKICGSVSYNMNDIQHLYCGRCHQFHSILEFKEEFFKLKKEP